MVSSTHVLSRVDYQWLIHQIISESFTHVQRVQLVQFLIAKWFQGEWQQSFIKFLRSI